MRKRGSRRATNVAYYWRNRDLELNRVKVRQAGTIELLRELRDVPCMDCGRRFASHQMDFDHRDPATKSFNLTKGRAMLMSTQRLMAEVAKCDVVCANCHRVRTRDMDQTRPRKNRTGSAEARKAAVWRDHSALLDMLRRKPCEDCGGSFPPCSMDFDHRDPSTKRFVVTRMRARATVERILAEVAKCDIVCANCHRLRTFERREAARLERE